MVKRLNSNVNKESFGNSGQRSSHLWGEYSVLSNFSQQYSVLDDNGATLNKLLGNWGWDKDFIQLMILHMKSMEISVYRN